MRTSKEDLVYLAQIINEAGALIVYSGGKNIELSGDIIRDIVDGLKLLSGEAPHENSKSAHLQ